MSEVMTPIELAGAILDGRREFRQVEIAGDVSLWFNLVVLKQERNEQCLLSEEEKLLLRGLALVRKTRISGELDFGQIIVHGSLCMDHLDITGSLLLDKATIEGDLGLLLTKIGGLLQLEGIRVQENISLMGATAEDVSCNDVAIWLQCWSYFGPKGIPVLVDTQAVRSLVSKLNL